MNQAKYKFLLNFRPCQIVGSFDTENFGSIRPECETFKTVAEIFNIFLEIYARSEVEICLDECRFHGSAVQVSIGENLQSRKPMSYHKVFMRHYF